MSKTDRNMLAFPSEVARIFAGKGIECASFSQAGVELIVAHDLAIESTNLRLCRLFAPNRFKQRAEVLRIQPVQPDKQVGVVAIMVRDEEEIRFGLQQRVTLVQ